MDRKSCRAVPWIDHINKARRRKEDSLKEEKIESNMNEDEEAGWIEQIHQESTKEVKAKMKTFKTGCWVETQRQTVETGHEDSSIKQETSA